MAASQISKASYHTRSISLPSAPHPISHQLDEKLCRLRSSQAASTSSSVSLSNKLNDLVGLYHCVDELLQLSSNQQSANQIQIMLDGSLRLLDICSTSRDFLVQSKEQLQCIQSVLRRRCSSDMNINKEVAEYLKTRKSAKMVVKNCLKDIKECDRNSNEGALKDVEDITIEIFKSLLSYIGGEKKCSWLSATKLINQNATKETTLTSEFDMVDATFDSLISKKKKTGINASKIEITRNQIVKLESVIQDLDEALECLFRHLIKTRATLLNILSN